MGASPLSVERHGAVVVWRLDNIASMNALTADLKAALAAEVSGFVADDRIRSAVLTGTGECFCAGGDLRSLSVDTATNSVRLRMKASHSWLKLMANSEKPVVVAVNGAAVGAGVSLAMAGDIVIASERAYFMAGFPKVGVLPDLAILYNLPRAIGLTRAKDFLMTNRRVEAEEALSMGMVSRMMPHAGVVDEAIAIASKLADGPSVSLGLTKALLNQSQNDSLEAFLSREETAQATVFGTEDFVEGNRAFREKRAPRFVGR